MSLLADLLSPLFERRYVFSGKQDDRSLAELCQALMTSQGEVSGTSIAHDILDGYATSDEDGKLAFFQFLNEEMDINPHVLHAALNGYKAVPSEANYRSLVHAAEAGRQELARRLNQVPGATARLVHMRKDLLRYIKDYPELARTDVDLRHLFRSWFNRGFLVLRPINWESPAQVLEKIITHEAVHAIHSWEDLHARLQPEDRRCFALFHPALPEEPLIFVEVALTSGVPSSIQSVLAQERDIIHAPNADTAVFYSISNCQAGLAGISFGNSLIKQVVSELSHELPQLKTYITLSPLPMFCRWADIQDIDLPEGDPSALRELAAHYLVHVKRPDNLPFDPVARFHLHNGALVHDIHTNADTSRKGQKQSAGVMVNYLYRLPRIAQNHEAFANQKTVIASKQVCALAKSGRERVYVLQDPNAPRDD